MLVATPLEGVPSAGVTSVGLSEKTRLPLPVALVPPVPPLATERIPVTPVERGSPVRLVATPLEGVPSAGVTSEGLSERTTLPVPVEEVAPVPPLATERVPLVIRAALIAGRSEAAMAPQAGALATAPVPVLVRNCLLVVVLPARRVPEPETAP